MNTTWLEISCDVPSDLVDDLAEFLSDLSGNGVCVENLNVDAFSTDEITLPTVNTVRAYFSEDDNIDIRLKEIREFLDRLAEKHPGLTLANPCVSTVSSEDWSSSWKENFKPLRVGRRLMIVPTWEEVPQNPSDIVLRLDPGMAFGTGGHETTRLCLELLERIMDQMPTLLSPAVLDLGTGSGILAMAAARLGANRICAVDIDPQAVEVAQENLALNNMADQVECSTTPLEELPGTFDVILANILAEELVRLAPELIRHLTAGGMLILSGILAEKEPLVRSGFTLRELEYQETLHQGEWVAMLYRRTATP